MEHNFAPWANKCRWCGASIADARVVACGGGEVQEDRRTRVYVAGPYTQGDPVLNTRRAILVGSQLLQRGYAPYVPHLTMFWHLVDPQDYQTWLDMDFEWVAVCDVLLRLDGPSAGADKERRLAETLKKGVYDSLDTLCACEPPRRLC